MFECWVIFDVCRHVGHRVLCFTLFSTGLLQLRIAQFLNSIVILTAVELGIGLHHWLLLVFWYIFQACSACHDWVFRA